MGGKMKKEVTPLVLQYILPDDWDEAEKEKNPISAKEVVEAIKGGKRVEIKNAVIEGDFILKSANVEGEITIQQTKIKGHVDWSYATFKQVLSFENSLFETDAIFTVAAFEKDILLNGATFKGEANFGNARIGGDAEFTEVRFKQLANFNSAHIEGSAFFRPATFEGDADFVSARIGGNADFEKAVFKQKFSLNNAQIEKFAFFKNATFEGEADFGLTRIGFNAEFDDAVFKQKFSFNSVKIEGFAFFKRATFEGEADFKSARIGGNAEFDDAVFKQKFSFNNAQIGGGTYFPGTIFADNVSFQDTSFKAIFFEYDGKVMAPLQANIDLSGCKYDRIQPISIWEDLMRHLKPYDRQPFTQLEKTFRKSGEDELANDVYYERKRRESGQKKLRKRSSAWLMDRFHWLLTGYGVRLYYLIGWIVLLLAIGTVIFHLNGAVVPNPNIKSPPEFGSQNTLSYLEAFWVSISTFLPVDIPSGADWKPSSQIIWLLSMKFTTFATMLKLSGWILVPVGVAGISGILKR